jgi:IS30 family transposase
MWSPQQIAGWLMREHPDDENKRVSHETIYRSLFIHTCRVLKKELLAHLRATRAIRRSRHATMKRSGQRKFNDAISIRDRPAEVEDRAVPGHWEGDLIAGSGNSFIATSVERSTRYVMLADVGNKDSHRVIQALIKQSRKPPKELYRSLTWDRGSEIAGHKTFTLATDIDVYLCEPHSPLSSLQAATTGQCMATRFKRKHQPASTTVLSKRHRFVDTQSSKVERRRQTNQRTPSNDARV